MFIYHPRVVPHVYKSLIFTIRRSQIEIQEFPVLDCRCAPPSSTCLYSQVLNLNCVDAGDTLITRSISFRAPVHAFGISERSGEASFARQNRLSLPKVTRPR